MTMLSFRLPSEDLADVDRWAERLGVDRSELVREAVRRYLVRLRSEAEELTGDAEPPPSLASLPAWGTSEEWAEWADATG